MYNIIVTGFGQIPHDAYNPSWDVVKSLPDEVNGVKINKYELDVSWDVDKKIKELIENTENLVCVLSIGMDSTLKGIRVEQFATNRRGPIEDVNGNEPDSTRVVNYISDIVTIDETIFLYDNMTFDELLEKTKEKAGSDLIIKGSLYSAGDYICNCCYYSSIFNSYKGEVQGYPQWYAQFIHIPTNNDITTQELTTLVQTHLETLIEYLWDLRN